MDALGTRVTDQAARPKSEHYNGLRHRRLECFPSVIQKYHQKQNNGNNKHYLSCVKYTSITLAKMCLFLYTFIKSLPKTCCFLSTIDLRHSDIYCHLYLTQMNIYLFSLIKVVFRKILKPQQMNQNQLYWSHLCTHTSNFTPVFRGYQCYTQFQEQFMGQ